jgi:predicted nucleotidyltransferase
MVKVFYFDREKVGAALQRYVQALRARPEVLQVIAFGSWVRGDSVPGSDVDLLIVLSHSDKRFLDRIPDYMPSHFPVGVDVFPYTRSEVERMFAENHSFLKRVLKEGQELFAKARPEGVKEQRTYEKL